PKIGHLVRTKANWNSMFVHPASTARELSTAVNWPATLMLVQQKFMCRSGFLHKIGHLVRTKANWNSMFVHPASTARELSTAVNWPATLMLVQQKFMCRSCFFHKIGHLVRTKANWNSMFVHPASTARELSTAVNWPA